MRLPLFLQKKKSKVTALLFFSSFYSETLIFTFRSTRDLVKLLRLVQLNPVADYSRMYLLFFL